VCMYVCTYVCDFEIAGNDRGVELNRGGKDV
jgi:hypothetical protein